MNEETRVDMNLEKNMHEEKPLKGLEDNKLSEEKIQEVSGGTGEGIVPHEVTKGLNEGYDYCPICPTMKPFQELTKADREFFDVLENDNIEFDNVLFRHSLRDK